MRTILFVDDEPHLLAGLRRMLRGKRREWEMLFANSGDEALQLLSGQPVDVVVSDMRMPGMDGARLLAEVRRLHPGTSRMILSGHADRATVISAVGPTQQFLSKPCDVDVLVAALERVLAVRDLVADQRLRELFGGVEALPKPPRVYEEMMRLAADPNFRLEDVVAVIEGDLATSTDVLHLVNTSFFGLPARVDSVARAVSLLGLETIQALAVAGAVFGRGGAPPPGVNPATLCRRGLLVASLTKRFALSHGWSREATDDIFFAGLLHEVALPLLAAARPQAWAQIRDHPFRDPFEEHELFVQAFGAGVTDATAYLLGLWGFGEAVVHAIGGQPARADDDSAPPAAQVLTLARRRALDPEVTIEPAPEGCYLTAERLRAWEVACADLAVDPDDEEEITAPGPPGAPGAPGAAEAAGAPGSPIRPATPIAPAGPADPAGPD